MSSVPYQLSIAIENNKKYQPPAEKETILLSLLLQKEAFKKRKEKTLQQVCESMQNKYDIIRLRYIWHSFCD